jgi:hypothetical protein
MPIIAASLVVAMTGSNVLWNEPPSFDLAVLKLSYNRFLGAVRTQPEIPAVADASSIGNNIAFARCFRGREAPAPRRFEPMSFANACMKT